MDRPLGIIVLVLVGVILGYLINNYMNSKKKQPEITSSMIVQRMSDCSDLTTCNLVYVDLVKYEQGSIPFITQKSFSMMYSANIRAGVDLGKAEVSVHPKKVTIKLPETEIQSIDVDTDSLRFYDEHFAILNWGTKEDISFAIKNAREDVEANANLDQLKTQARHQAEKVVQKMIGPIVGNSKELEII